MVEFDPRNYFLDIPELKHITTLLNYTCDDNEKLCRSDTLLELESLDVNTIGMLIEIDFLQTQRPERISYEKYILTLTYSMAWKITFMLLTLIGLYLVLFESKKRLRQLGYAEEGKFESMFGFAIWMFSMSPKMLMCILNDAKLFIGWETVQILDTINTVRGIVLLIICPICCKFIIDNMLVRLNFI